MGLDIEGGGESAVTNRVSSSSQKDAHQQLTVLNATIAVDCAAHMLNLQCINASKALNCNFLSQHHLQWTANDD